MQLIFSPEEQYSCTLCGECCQDSLAEVSEAEVERLEAALQKLESTKRDSYLPIAHVVNDVLVLSHSSESQCQFLSENACRVHAEVGEGVLPSLCQLYPFRLTSTPGGIFASTSFCCPAVLAGTGSSVESHEPRLRKLLSSQPVPALVCDPEIALTGSKMVTWEDYLVWEGALLTSLDSANILDSLNQAARALYFPLDEENPQSSEIMQVELEAGVLQLTELALGFCEFPDSWKSREKLIQDVKDSPGQPISSSLGCSLYPMRLGSTASESMAFNQFLQRWIRNHISGKRLLGDGNVFCNLLAVSCATNLILYYYEQLKPKDQAFHFCFETLRACFKTSLTGFLNNLESLIGIFTEFEKMFVKIGQVHQGNSD